MRHRPTVEFEDMQALLRSGLGRLSEARFLLLQIRDAAAARAWIGEAPVDAAAGVAPAPRTALQLAFSAPGLRALGLGEAALRGFSAEFVEGMAGDANRSRRLGDIGGNDPARWTWGGDPDTLPHLLLMLYARPGGLEAWQRTCLDGRFAQGFRVMRELPTSDLGGKEPFGFRDGISQPRIDWQARQSTDPHRRDRYSNWLAPGEVALGYRNEYGEFTDRPLLADSGTAQVLPQAEGADGARDLGRNGSYLVLRQLRQDVAGFWRYLDQQAQGDAAQRERLAAALVGRRRDGRPLVAGTEVIPGVPRGRRLNRFTFVNDPRGHACPFGAHVRRANPRTGDFPPDVTGWWSRLVRRLGFGRRAPDDDLIASTRFHRLLRRGRPYGPPLDPEAALSVGDDEAERGLQFICLVANISRQFEFVQNAWCMNAKFNVAQQEGDPLLGNRCPLAGGEATDRFRLPQPDGPARTLQGLPRFVTVTGGAYFFLPGLRALRYLSRLPGETAERAP